MHMNSGCSFPANILVNILAKRILVQDILADVPCLLSVSILNATLSTEAVNKIYMPRLCYLVSGKYISLMKCSHIFQMLIINVSGAEN